MGDAVSLFTDGLFKAGGRSLISEQSISDISPVEPEQDLAVRRAGTIGDVNLLVDYSDFANFVRFNSAYEYFSISADKILNEYPLGGTADRLQLFRDSLDGYQRYVLSLWPSSIGHLRFNPAVSSSLVRFDDFGSVDGKARSSLLSPGTGSISVQGWYHSPVLTGSEDAMVLFQKAAASGDGYTVFLSGSQVYFQVASGSTVQTVSAVNPGTPSFFSAVMDRTSWTGSVYLLTASLAEYPVVAASSSLGFFGRMDLGSGSFYIGSGSLSGKTVCAFSGNVDDFSVWSSPRLVPDLSGSYNRKIFAQPGLLGAWRFNETRNAPTNSTTAVLIRDAAGHRLDGRIQNFFADIRGSGSIAFDSPDPILSFEDPDVVSYIVEGQTSGSVYDATNQSLITKLFPAAFTSVSGDPASVFRRFTYVLARQFDVAWLNIKQFANLRRCTYDDFDQVPDALLGDALQFYGWDPEGSFVENDALRYLLGLQVLPGAAGNAELDQKLFELKDGLWRRTLQNLPYIYKAKGTREAVEALLRVHGADGRFVRLREYGVRPEVPLEVRRVEAERSVLALTFGSGSNTTGSVQSVDYNGGSYTGLFRVGTSAGELSAELRVRFPGPTDTEMPPTQASGTLLTLQTGSIGSLQVGYEKVAATSATGTVFLTSSAGRLDVASVPIFDGRWYNLAVVREAATGSVLISVMCHEEGELLFHTSSYAATGSVGCPVPRSYDHITVGTFSGTLTRSEYWAQELRLWDASLSEGELSAHSIDPMSYGRERFLDASRPLQVHWRLWDGVAADAGGHFPVLGTTAVPGTGSGFLPGDVPFERFLQEYAYISTPGDGWSEDKVRTYDGISVPSGLEVEDGRLVSLDFGMVSALDEDITHMMSSLRELNDILGLPAARYRGEYEALGPMRENYFRRLQGRLNFRLFADMLDFFDRSFVGLVRRLIPARTDFIGDELVVESHILERPKYQYHVRPVREGTFTVEGAIRVTDPDA